MNKLKVSLILLALIFALSGCGGHNVVNPENTPKGNSWAKEYSGVALFNSVQEMPDKGYILVGDTDSWDGSVISNILVLKVNSNGNKEWAKAFGWNNSYNGSPIVQSTNDGGYFVAGVTGSYVKGSGRFIIIKFNSKNEEEWAKAFGLGDKTIISFPCDFAVQQVSDGGFVVMMPCADGHFVLKLDSKGNKEWLKVFVNKTAFFRSAKQTEDGGYIIAGGIQGPPIGLLIKLKGNGRIEWAKKYKVSKWGNEFDDVEPTKDGGFIVVASGIVINIESKSAYSLILKLDKNGNEEWKKMLGSRVVSVKQTNDGGYIAIGWKTIGNGDNDFIIKLDSKGNTEWGKLIERENSFRVIKQTTDGGYIAVGMNTVFKFDSRGDVKDLLCSKSYIPEMATSPPEIKVTDITKYIKTEPEPSFRSKLVKPLFKIADVKTTPVNCSDRINTGTSFEKVFVGIIEKSLKIL